MTESRTQRVLVVTDAAEPSKSLRDAIRHRAEAGDAQFRLVVLNPERHDRAAAAEVTLRSALPQLELAAHAPVIGSVSVRHDPMDAIEETLFAEPVDEIILDVPPHHFSSWLHQNLEHRLAHFHIPIVAIRHDEKGHETRS